MQRKHKEGEWKLQIDSCREAKPAVNRVDSPERRIHEGEV